MVAPVFISGRTSQARFKKQYLYSLTIPYLFLVSSTVCLFPYLSLHISTHKHTIPYLFLVSSTVCLWSCISLRIFAISCCIMASSRCFCRALCFSSFSTICLAWSWESFLLCRCFSCFSFSSCRFSRFSFTYNITELIKVMASL